MLTLNGRMRNLSAPAFTGEVFTYYQGMIALQLTMKPAESLAHAGPHAGTDAEPDIAAASTPGVARRARRSGVQSRILMVHHQP
ncbi:MAG: hypothetical protein KDA64_09810 [Rhodospirillaceae bacterium]|nr:hypothetical protein [Rhodospirillaceae bacterium]